MSQKKWAVGAVKQGEPMSSMTKQVFVSREAADARVDYLNSTKGYSVVVVQDSRFFQLPGA